jgi:methionyl-tRNA formyltransferase
MEDSMRVLLLSPYPEKLDSVWTDEIVLSAQDSLVESDYELADWIVSYGYRHIIKEPILSKYRGRIINIHIGYLPWNRGADPNFWSWYDDTPKGVTIHQMDEGIDTGPILARRAMRFNHLSTLATSYAKLQERAEELFRYTWPAIRNGLPATPQPDKGFAAHKKKDREAIWHHFPLQWDTPVAAVEEFGRKARGEHGTESREATGA